MITLSPRKNLETMISKRLTARAYLTHILLMNLSLFTGLPFFPFVTGVSVHISFCT